MSHLAPPVLRFDLLVSLVSLLLASPAAFALDLAPTAAAPAGEPVIAQASAEEDVPPEDELVPVAPVEPALLGEPVNPLIAGGIAGGIGLLSAPALGAAGFFGGGIALSSVGCLIGAGLGALGSVVGLLVAGARLNLDAALPIGISAGVVGGAALLAGIAALAVAGLVGATGALPFLIAAGAGVVAGLVGGVIAGIVTGLLAPERGPPPTTSDAGKPEASPVLVGAMSY